MSDKWDRIRAVRAAKQNEEIEVEEISALNLIESVLQERPGNFKSIFEQLMSDRLQGIVSEAKSYYASALMGEQEVEDPDYLPDVDPDEDEVEDPDYVEEKFNFDKDDGDDGDEDDKDSKKSKSKKDDDGDSDEDDKKSKSKDKKENPFKKGGDDEKSSLKGRIDFGKKGKKDLKEAIREKMRLRNEGTGVMRAGGNVLSKYGTGHFMKGKESHAKGTPAEYDKVEKLPPCNTGAKAGGGFGKASGPGNNHDATMSRLKQLAGKSGKVIGQG